MPWNRDGDWEEDWVDQSPTSPPSGDWFADNDEGVSTTRPVPMPNDTPLPSTPSYTAEEQDFLRRNPGDQGRMAQALKSNKDPDGSRRDFDSQSGYYDTRTHQLNAAGIAATARRLNPLAQLTGGASNPDGIDSGDSGGGESVGGGGGASSLAGSPWADWSHPDFVAPDAQSIFNDPGFKSRLQQSQLALQNSAASKGSYFTPNTLEQLMGRAGEMASDEYGNAWNRDFGEWQSGFNTSRQTRMDDFGIDESLWNRSDVDRKFKFGEESWNKDFGLRQDQLDFSKDSFGKDFDFRQGARAYDENRMSYLDDFGMWDNMQDDFYDRQFRLANGGNQES